MLEDCKRHVIEALGDPDAVWNVDETGFPKKGTKSVGVKRQYSGTLGRTDNCQIGVFANYCSAKGHTFMDRRLFLPKEWADDPTRAQEAGVPDGWSSAPSRNWPWRCCRRRSPRGVPFRWVGGDSVYGDSPTFVQGVRRLGQVVRARHLGRRPGLATESRKSSPPRRRGPTRAAVHQAVVSATKPSASMR